MTYSTVTAKGQTTVPREIREQIGAVPGTRLLWAVMPNGTVIVRAKNVSILDLAGSLKSRRRKKLSIEDMNPWR